FSDFVILDEASGGVGVLKVPSTPREPSDAVLAGLALLAERGLARGRVGYFSHGTTIATNALLEGKGARVGLLITRGFRAVQDVQDQTRGAGPRCTTSSTSGRRCSFPRSGPAKCPSGWTTAARCSSPWTPMPRAPRSAACWRRASIRSPS